MRCLKAPCKSNDACCASVMQVTATPPACLACVLPPHRHAACRCWWLGRVTMLTSSPSQATTSRSSAGCFLASPSVYDAWAVSHGMCSCHAIVQGSCAVIHRNFAHTAVVAPWCLKLLKSTAHMRQLRKRMQLWLAQQGYVQASHHHCRSAGVLWRRALGHCGT